MKKNFVLFLLCLSVALPMDFVHPVSPIPERVSQSPEPDMQRLRKMVPYALALTCIAGGLSALLIGYFWTKSCNEKIMLLKQIEIYCKANNLDPTALFSQEILLFAQQQQETKVLQEILQRHDTLETLSRKEFASKILAYGGGALIGIGALAIIITAIVQLVTRKKPEQQQQSPAITIPPKVTTLPVVGTPSKATTTSSKKQPQPEPTSPVIIAHDKMVAKAIAEEAAFDAMATEIINKLSIKNFTDPAQKGKLEEFRDNFLAALPGQKRKKPEPRHLSHYPFCSVVEQTFERHRDLFSAAVQKRFQSEVIAMIKPIVAEANKNPDEFYSIVRREITNRIYTVHGPLIFAKKLLAPKAGLKLQ